MTFEEACAYLQERDYEMRLSYPGSNDRIVKAPSWYCDLVMTQQKIIDHAQERQREEDKEE